MIPGHCHAYFYIGGEKAPQISYYEASSHGFPRCPSSLGVVCGGL